MTGLRPRRWSVGLSIGLLILLVLVSVVVRITEDWPAVAARDIPDADDYAARYVLHPALAYTHILCGLVYLLGAPLQLNRRFREAHFTVHRRLGPVVVSAGVIAGLGSLVFGTLYPWGRIVEASATVVFGGAFVTSLVTAVVAIKRGDVTRHRRWMIRAFALGLGVGTIRIWVIIALTLMGGSQPDPLAFGLAFWLAFSMHAVAAELYLRRRPGADGKLRPSSPSDPALSLPS